MSGRLRPGGAAFVTFAFVLAGCSSGRSDGATPAEIESRHLERHGIAVRCSETTADGANLQRFRCTEIESFRTLIVAEDESAPNDFVVTLVDDNGDFVADYSLD